MRLNKVFPFLGSPRAAALLSILPLLMLLYGCLTQTPIKQPMGKLVNLQLDPAKPGNVISSDFLGDSIRAVSHVRVRAP